MKQAGPLYLLIWLLLSAFAALAAWYLNLAILYLFTLWLAHPQWLPLGWNSGTIVAINKLSILGLGSLWLILVTWLEGTLRSSALEGKLWRHTGRIGLLLALLLIGSLAILRLG